MAKYEYEVLTSKHQLDVPGSAVWFSSSDMDTPLGHDLANVLNEYGEDGWEIVGIGDVAFNGRAEIILKRLVDETN